MITPARRRATQKTKGIYSQRQASDKAVLRERAASIGRKNAGKHRQTKEDGETIANYLKNNPLRRY